VAKRQIHEEHENHERWLVSYADFITLLFAFFVVLYSVSRVDNKRMVQVVSAIKFAMHFKGTGGVDKLPMFEGPPSEGGCVANVGTDKKNAKPDTRPQIEALRRKLEKRLRDFLQSRKADHSEVQFEIEGKRLIIRLSASRFFDPSQAAIRPEVLPVLDAIASELVETKKNIRIEGHTDDSPVGGSRYRDNWELSAARAAAVASYIQRAYKIDGRLLAAAGFGSNRPLVKNDTAAGREANRRVEMAVELGAADTLMQAGDL
jgi:chemotaxis protein MotB